MTPSAKKQFNTSIGSLFLVLGVVAWGMAVYFAVKPADSRRVGTVTLAQTVDRAECQRAIGQLYGFSAQLKNDGAGGKGDLLTVRAAADELVDARRLLKDATAAAALCKREIVDFCMGTTCDKPGMNMTLGLSDVQRAVPKGGAASAPK